MGRDATFTTQKQDMTNGFKVTAFYREFPWLSKHTPQEKVREIKVSRLEHETMVTCPSGLLEITLLDQEGNTVSKVGIKYGLLGAILHLGQLKQTETVAETVERIGKEEADKVTFVLFKKRKSMADGEEIDSKFTLTIYKMPKAFPKMTGWIAELNRRAANALNQQIAAVDTVSE